MQRAKVLNFLALCFGSGFLAPFNAVASNSYPLHDIVGGEIVSDLNSFEYKHTVRLLVKGTLEGSNLPDGLRGLKLSWRCSGALVTRQIVISAAHCFPKTIGLTDPKTGQPIRAGLSGVAAEVFFKTDTRADRPWGVKSEKIVVHSGFRDDWTAKVDNVWNPKEPIHDIALLKMTEEASADKAPVPVLGFQEEPLSAGEEAILAGYGRDLSDDQVAIPRLRRVDAPLRQPLQNSSEWYVGRGDLDKAGKVDRPKGGCVGDSGGPLFLKRGAGVRLAGLIVRGPDDQNGGCSAAVTIVTALPIYMEWISENLKLLQAR